MIHRMVFYFKKIVSRFPRLKRFLKRCLKRWKRCMWKLRHVGEKTSVYAGDMKEDVPSVFYLKVNRRADYTLLCIQKWLDVVAGINGIAYIICDNKELEEEILRECIFDKEKTEIIPSIRGDLLKTVEALGITMGRWGFATCAHLTPFYHAKAHGFQYYWAIDADDTMFCLPTEQIVKILRQVGHMAKQEDVSAISLDMWRSHTGGKHWTFGIVYINDNVDFCHIFDSHNNFEWVVPYTDGILTGVNLDWFFTYLKDAGNIKIETFYPENCWFIHWGSFIRNPIGAMICYWHAGEVFYPIMKDVFKNKDMGVMNIADCRGVFIGADINEGPRFLNDEIALWIPA